MGFHINYGSYIMLTYVHHKIVKCHTCNMTTHTFKQELPMISYDIQEMVQLLPSHEGPVQPGAHPQPVLSELGTWPLVQGSHCSFPTVALNKPAPHAAKCVCVLQEVVGEMQEKMRDKKRIRELYISLHKNIHQCSTVNIQHKHFSPYMYIYTFASQKHRLTTFVKLFHENYSYVHT